MAARTWFDRGALSIFSKENKNKSWDVNDMESFKKQVRQFSQRSSCSLMQIEEQMTLRKKLKEKMKTLGYNGQPSLLKQLVLRNTMVDENVEESAKSSSVCDPEPSNVIFQTKKDDNVQ